MQNSPQLFAADRTDLAGSRLLIDTVCVLKYRASDIYTVHGVGKDTGFSHDTHVRYRFFFT